MDIDLNDLTEKTLVEMEAEKLDARRQEVKRKLRHLYERISTLRNLMEHHEKQIQKAQEGIKKVEEKITQIKQGNWNVLNQVNPNEKLPEIPEEKEN